MTDKRTIAAQNRAGVLQWLHRFGWLTSQQLAQLVWPAAKSAIRLAQRALQALAEERLVQRRELPIGGSAYVLTPRGAKMLASEFGLPAVSGTSLLLGNTMHRAASNWHLIKAASHEPGVIFYTEHEIQVGRAPIKCVLGKTPDGLLVRSDDIAGGHDVHWVEVENAWKNRREREKVVTFCRDALSERHAVLPEGYVLAGVEILAINLDAARSMTRTLLEYYDNEKLSDWELQFIDVVIAEMSGGMQYPDRVERLNAFWHLAHPPQ